jgi:parallel beta-helix repeat protein
VPVELTIEESSSGVTVVLDDGTPGVTVVTEQSGGVVVSSATTPGPRGPGGDPGPPGTPGDGSAIIVEGFTQSDIDDAVDELATTGGKLIFPPGTYSGNLALDGYSNLTIEGYGALISCADTSVKPVNISNGSFIRIFGLRVRHTDAPDRVSGGNGINLHAVTDFVVSGCHVTTVSSAGIVMRGCERGTVVGNTVRDNWADGIHVTGISATAISKDISIEGNHLSNTGDDAISVVSYQTAPSAHENVTITGNTIRQSKARGISVLGGKRITVVGNTVEQTRASGILVCYDVTYSTYGVEDCVVEGNTVYLANTYDDPDTTKYGIEIASSSATHDVENIIVANNIVRSSANRGIFINNYVRQSIVSANTVMDAGHMGISAVGARHIQIVGNTVLNSARQGVHVENDVDGSILVGFNTVVDANTSNTASTDAFQLRAPGMDVFANRVIDNNGFIERDFEFSASGTDAFFWGNHTSGVATESVLAPSASRFVRSLAMTQGSAAPTTGTWKVGDIVFNTGVTASGTVAWVCTTAGTPGTWTAWSIAGGGGSITVTDTAEIDLTLTGSALSAVLRANSIAAARLAPAVQTSLGLADGAVQRTGDTMSGNLTAPAIVFGLDGQVLFGADGSINAYNTGGEAYVGMHGTGQLMGGQRLRINPQTGTTYTLTTDDRAGLITRTNAADSTQTLPNDTVILGIGSTIRTLNLGPGDVTHVAGSGATVSGQLVQKAGESSVAIKTAANTWHVSGSKAVDAESVEAAGAVMQGGELDADLQIPPADFRGFRYYDPVTSNDAFAGVYGDETGDLGVQMSTDGWYAGSRFNVHATDVNDEINAASRFLMEAWSEDYYSMELRSVDGTTYTDGADGGSFTGAVVIGQGGTNKLRAVWYGTSFEYAAIVTKDPQTAYLLSDGGIYLGEIAVSSTDYDDLENKPTDTPSIAASGVVLIWNDIDDYIPENAKASTHPKEFRGPTDPATIDGVVLNPYDTWIET